MQQEVLTINIIDDELCAKVTEDIGKDTPNVSAHDGNALLVTKPVYLDSFCL